MSCMHHKKVCSKCEKIISQCRCMDANKSVIHALCDECKKASPESEKFTFFWKSPLSQWQTAHFVRESVWYSCAEQYMMAEKAMMFGDMETRRKIMGAVDPADQKKYGREVKNFNEEEWNKVARDIVFRGNYARFTYNKDQKALLLSTAGTTLVETSPYDKIWGIGLRKDDPRAKKRETWLGLNWLGETLTKVREAIIKDEA